MNHRRKALTYRDAGVDIDKGNRLVERIKSLIEPTLRPEVLAAVGGFGALFQVPEGYRQPVLVCGADGVGTKLKLALDLGVHDTIGIDLVAMCVNDILTQGAAPLFFLDYFATGRLDEDIATDVIKGVAEGCRRCGAALIGGETAEMPGLYAGDDYDLAGFCVGIVERDAIVDGHAIGVGDALIGLGSSGAHANGYSLIRRALALTNVDLDTRIGEATLAEALLEPTRIYASEVQHARQTVHVRGMAHITGGGLTENVPRMLPRHTGARLRLDAWPRPPVFDWLQSSAGIAAAEMHRTFNCGIGLVLCVAADDAARTVALLNEGREQAYHLGEVIATDARDRVVIE